MNSTKRPQAEVKHSLSDLENCAPSASVTHGRALRGFLFDQDHNHCVALTPDRELIGIFSDRSTAAFAIAAHHDITAP
jgi:hypothetical protein